jgi:hypothetical protein
MENRNHQPSGAPASQNGGARSKSNNARMAMEIVKKADPKITAAVLLGDMSLTQAARITRLFYDQTSNFTEEVTHMLKRWPIGKAPEVRALLCELTAPFSPAQAASEKERKRERRL